MSSPSKKPSVLAVGRLYCDFIFTGLPRMPTLGTEVFADSFGAHAGGGAFITAAHLSQLGHASFLAAMLPQAPYNDLMQSDLTTSNVDLSMCASLSNEDGPQMTVAMVSDSDRSFLTHRAGPAFPKISVNDIKKHDVRHIHIGEITSLIANPDIIDMAHSLGITISTDCGWDDDFDARQLQPFLGKIDLFLPNQTEMDELQNTCIGDKLASITVVKRGDQGATLFAPGQTLNMPAFLTEVIDTTGAGDAFNAGFLSMWLEGASHETSLKAGNQRGALSVRTRGGFSPVTGSACIS
ncbi:MAG: carbohydrate kinase family protein [Pseudoprimorskyibacter sp.]|nr:carbohydrate kinase family protein [Pseudoprimorskyibacter sp.]